MNEQCLLIPREFSDTNLSTTRMHSSRMRTGRTLTVGGGVHPEEIFFEGKEIEKKRKKNFRHPPRKFQTPPGADPPGSRHPPKQTSRHPPQSRHPPEQIPPENFRHAPGADIPPPRSRHHPPEQTPPGSRHPPC